jgi:hypothetical protein
MVPRAQLHAALSQLDATQAERGSFLNEVADLKSQVNTTREQLEKSTAEATLVRSALSAMVPRSEFMDSEARYSTLHAMMVNTSRQHCEAMGEVQSRVLTLESEKAALSLLMQVNAARCMLSLHNLF